MKWRAPSASAFWLWLAFFLPAASIYHPRAGWNVNTRLDLIFALVDHGTFQIDLYHDLEPFATGDKAVFEGHYYSDKVFGLSLVSVPFYAALKFLSAIFGKEPFYDIAHWWVRCFGVSAFAAMLCVMLCRMFQRMGVGGRPAFALAAGLFFGTLLFPYSTVFYPLLPGCFFCLWAWRRIEEAGGGEAGGRGNGKNGMEGNDGMNGRRESEAPAGLPGAGLRQAFFPAMLTGLGLGAAMLMDFIFGLVVVWLGARAVWRWIWASEGRGGPGGWLGLVARALGLALGGALPLALFALYCRSIFGSFSIPYQYEADELFRQGMAQGFMGVQRFQAAVLYYLTIHPYRGLFFYSPLLAAALAGALRMIFASPPLPGGDKQNDWTIALIKSWRWAGLSAWALFAAYMAFNASYYMWWGGWAMGPRLMIPAIPFMGLGLAGLWTWGRCGRAAVLASGAWSILATLGPALVDPQTPMWLHRTPELLAPAISQNLAAEQFLQMILFSRGMMDPMLGHALGLQGLWALAPMLILFGFPAFMYLRRVK